MSSPIPCRQSRQSVSSSPRGSSPRCIGADFSLRSPSRAQQELRSRGSPVASPPTTPTGLDASPPPSTPSAAASPPPSAPHGDASREPLSQMTSGVSGREPSAHQSTGSNVLLTTKSCTSALVSGLMEKLNSHRLTQRLGRGFYKVGQEFYVCFGVASYNCNCCGAAR